MALWLLVHVYKSFSWSISARPEQAVSSTTNRYKNRLMIETRQGALGCDEWKNDQHIYEKRVATGKKTRFINSAGYGVRPEEEEKDAESIDDCWRR